MSASSEDQPGKSRRGNGEGWLSWREDRQRWVAEYVVDDFTTKRRRVSRSFKTQREATAYLAKLRTQAERGISPSNNRMTFGEVLDYWLSEVVEPSKLAANTKSSYRETITLHVKPGLGKHKLVKLKYEHVQAFINDKRNNGYSKSSMRTMMVVVRSALQQAVSMEQIDRNVARFVAVPEPLVPTAKVKGWKPDEAQRFLNAAAEHELFTLFVLASMVGPRRGEVLGLEWHDFDEIAGTLRVERQVLRIKGVPKLQVAPLKSEKSRRTIHLPRRCVDLLVEHRVQQEKQRIEAGERWHDLGVIFTTGIGTHIEPRRINHWMEDLCDEAELPRAGLHKLRHTAATIARALGVDWKEIQAMLGHASAQITMDIYVDDIPEFQRDAADRIDSGFVVVNRPHGKPGKESSSKSSSVKKKGGQKTKKTPSKGRLPGGLSARSEGFEPPTF